MLPDTLKGAPCLLHGARFDVHAVEIAGRDGNPRRREIVVHPGAVVILPLLAADTIVMIRNQRLAVGQTLWELPAGTLEKGEPPEVCAARELIEETGFRAKRLGQLADFYTSPGICTERMFAFVARELEEVGQQLDEGEKIEVHRVAWPEVMRMLRDGEIRDGKTIATLLYYRCFVAAGSA